MLRLKFYLSHQFQASTVNGLFYNGFKCYSHFTHTHSHTQAHTQTPAWHTLVLAHADPFNLWLQAFDSEWSTMNYHEVSERVSTNIATSTTVNIQWWRKKGKGVNNSYFEGRDAAAKRRNVFQSCICYLGVRVCKCTSAISMRGDVKWHCGRIVSSSPSAEAGLFPHKQSRFRETNAQGHKLEVGRRALQYPSPGWKTLRDSLLQGNGVRDERQTPKTANRNSVRKWEEEKHSHWNTRKTLCPRLLWAGSKYFPAAGFIFCNTSIFDCKKIFLLNTWNRNESLMGTWWFLACMF